MAEYLSPGTFVEEVSGGIKPIEGVGTSTGAFIGIAEKGPVAGAAYEDETIGKPVFISNFTEFTRNFVRLYIGEFLAYSLQDCVFQHGTRCDVARDGHFTEPTDPSTLTAKRASAPLGGVTRTLAAGITSGAVQASLSSSAG